MRHTTIMSISAALGFALGSAGAFAQTTPSPTVPPPPSQSLPATSATTMRMKSDSMMQGQDSMHTQSRSATDRMGMQHSWMATHTMPGKVTSVDKSTGMVDMTSEGKQLHLHFPPSALGNLNTGDHITVRLAFRKD